MTAGISYAVVVEGLNALRMFDKIPAAIERCAIRAINKTTDRARASARRRVLEQVAFPASYLNPSQKRLTSRKARKGMLEGAVSGRVRPTSLARFTKQRPLRPGQRSPGGVQVQVKRGGGARFLRGAFLIPLRSGADGTLGNIGLAIRSETQPPGSYKPKKIGKNLWLLYGPAINQVLYSVRNQGGVIEDIAPETLDFLNQEFARLLNVEISRAR